MPDQPAPNHGIVVTQQDMYNLLQKVDRTVSGMSLAHAQQAARLDDHESRIRAIEAEEDLSRRITQIESALEALRAQIAELQRRVWAIPSAATLIALASVVIAFTR